MTLAERLDQGRIPVPESLRLAMGLAEALRRLHDRGEVHGAVTPSNVIITAQGLELGPATLGSTTPYTPPEVALGYSPDARSDVFSFGAILFEMLTGRRAFESADGAAPSSGSPVVDRLLLPCLANDPDARTPRIQRVILELKLVMVTAKRAEAAAAPKRERLDVETVRVEVRELEARLESRLNSQMQAHERNLAEFHRSAGEAMAAMKGLLSRLRVVLAEAEERPAPAATKEQLDAASRRILAEVERSYGVMGDRVALVEGTIDEMMQRTRQFEHSVAADLVDLEEGLKAQSSSLQSARTAMSQTDDLVERVVEALEKLQAAVLDERGVEGERSPIIIN